MQDFITFVAGVMEVEPSKLTPQTAYNSISEWDSLMHMRLVMEIEEEYDVDIPIDKVAELTTIDDLYAFIQE